jgi:hypothetical protein
MSDQETENTDTPEDTEETQDTTFQMGDYKSFFSYVGYSLLHLFIALTIGIHVIYSCRNNFDNFIKEYFPTNEQDSPFCYTTNSDCNRSWWYRDTNIETVKYVNGEPKTVKELYNPEFNIDITKKINNSSGETTIKGTFDEEYPKWILFWWNNTFMKMNIYNNKIYKYVFEGLRSYIDLNKTGFIDTLIVLFGWLFVIMFFVMMTHVSIITYIMGGFNAYKNKSWILAAPWVGAAYLWVMHMGKGNSFQAMMSFGGIFLGFIYQFLIMLSGIVVMLLPIIKWIRIYIWNALVMFFYLIKLIGTKIYNSFSKTPINNPIDNPKYAKMMSYFSEFSTSIFIIISIFILSAAYTYLTKGITIGMAICCIYLIYVYRHSENK